MFRALYNFPCSLNCLPRTACSVHWTCSAKASLMDILQLLNSLSLVVKTWLLGLSSRDEHKACLKACCNADCVWRGRRLLLFRKEKNPLVHFCTFAVPCAHISRLAGLWPHCGAVFLFSLLGITRTWLLLLTVCYGGF